MSSRYCNKQSIDESLSLVEYLAPEDAVVTPRGDARSCLYGKVYSPNSLTLDNQIMKGEKHNLLMTEVVGPYNDLKQELSEYLKKINGTVKGRGIRVAFFEVMISGDPTGEKENKQEGWFVSYSGCSNALIEDKVLEDVWVEIKGDQQKEEVSKRAVIKYIERVSTSLEIGSILQEAEDLRKKLQSENLAEPTTILLRIGYVIKKDSETMEALNQSMKDTQKRLSNSIDLLIKLAALT